MSAISRRAGHHRNWIARAFLLVLLCPISALGAFVTFPKIPGWYSALAKPPFNPRPFVFGPVWSILYVLMAVAAWQVWVRPASAARHAGLVRFGIQLALNAPWSPAVFGLEQPRLALAIIIALLISLAIALCRFFSVDRLAGWMLLPDLDWVGFASVLNGAIVALN